MHVCVSFTTMRHLLDCIVCVVWMVRHLQWTKKEEHFLNFYQTAVTQQNTLRCGWPMGVGAPGGNGRRFGWSSDHTRRHGSHLITAFKMIYTDMASATGKQAAVCGTFLTRWPNRMTLRLETSE